LIAGSICSVITLGLPRFRGQVSGINGCLPHRNACVAEVAGAVASRNVQVAAEGDRQMGEITADTGAISKGLAGALVRRGGAVIKADVLMHPVGDGLHQRPAGLDAAEGGLGPIHQGRGVAIGAGTARVSPHYSGYQVN